MLARRTAGLQSGRGTTKTTKPAKAGQVVQFGWGAGIRTPECWYQKPVPYRLATPQLYGGYDGNRTCDPSILSAVLYPAELRSQIVLHFNDGWDTWIRTRECRYQKPVPYRLAIPHPCKPMTEMVREARLELAHLAAPEPKSGASTNFATPAQKRWWLLRESNL